MSPPPSERSQADRDRVAALALVEQLQAALRQDDRAATVEVTRRLVALRAPMGGQWQELAQIAAENGEIGLARAAIGLYAESAAGNPVARYQQAGLLAHIGLWGEARAVMRTLPADALDPAACAHSRGTAALYLGDTDEARDQLERALAIRPLSGSSWLSFATLVDFAREPDLAERLVAGEPAMENAPPVERGTYYYALGKAHADRGAHAPAFAAYARGARQLKSLFAYSRERDRISATQAVNGYDADGIATIAREQSEPTARSIFVTGLPRSGTTLVEQILTSHSAVSDGAEINRLSLFVKDIRDLSYPALRRYVDETGAPAAARLWNHWLEERFPAPGRVVDKTTNTGRLLGLAAALLPEAPLVWLRRDPLDCAWSCFRTCFMGTMPWSYDLQDIAFHFRLEDQLFAQWQRILGDRLLAVPYEALVTDPGQWIPRILAHCGLPEEPQVYAPHENPRLVATSSVMQIRRPINRDGIGSAEPYRPFLAPFVEAYSD